MAKWSVAAESIWTQKYRRLSLVADRVFSARPPRSPALGRTIGEAYRAHKDGNGRPSLKKHLPSARDDARNFVPVGGRTKRGCRVNVRRARPAVTSTTPARRRARATATGLDTAGRITDCSGMLPITQYADSEESGRGTHCCVYTVHVSVADAFGEKVTQHGNMKHATITEDPDTQVARSVRLI